VPQELTEESQFHRGQRGLPRHERGGDAAMQIRDARNRDFFRSALAAFADLDPVQHDIGEAGLDVAMRVARDLQVAAALRAFHRLTLRTLSMTSSLGVAPEV
jgi:hypothetical protein